MGGGPIDSSNMQVRFLLPGLLFSCGFKFMSRNIESFIFKKSLGSTFFGGARTTAGRGTNVAGLRTEGAASEKGVLHSNL